MAHVPLKPIGAPRASVIDDRAYRDHSEDIADRKVKLDAVRAEARAGWGAKYAARVHEKGKLTARERIERLRDQDSELYELGTLVNHGEKFGELSSPAAGVVTAFAPVAGRRCRV